jgi:hypothetical protein
MAHEKQYKTIKNEITNKTETAQQFLEHLDLPKFDPKENPKQLKLDLLKVENNPELQKLQAEAKAKRDLLEQRIQQAQAAASKLQEKKKGADKLKMWVKVIIILLRTRREAIKLRIEKRE